MLKASKTKSGQSSVVAAFHSDFPVSRTITIYRTGTVNGDGLDLQPVLDAMNR